MKIGVLHFSSEHVWFIKETEVNCCCRFAVIMQANNGFGGFGEVSDTAILLTKPAMLAQPRVISARMTEILIQWDEASGRQENLLGYNISYTLAVPAGFSRTGYTFSQGTATQFSVVGLQSNRSYVFSVAAVNAGGTGDFSLPSMPAQTQAVDHLAACSLYPMQGGLLAGAPAVAGSFLLQELGLGQGSVTGIVVGLPIAGAQLDPHGGPGWALSVWQYGQSLTGSTGEVYGPWALNSSTTTLTNATLGSISVSLAMQFSLHGPQSIVAWTLVIQLLGPSSVSSQRVDVARCEIGVSRPRDSGAINDASPSPTAQTAGRAFCTLAANGGISLSGGFIASVWDVGNSRRYF